MGRTRPVHLAYLVTALAACVLHLASPTAVRLAIVTAASALAVVGITIGMRLNRIQRRSTWYILLLGTVLFTIFNYLWFMDLGLGVPVGAHGPAVLLLQVVAYVCILSAALMVVFRHGAGDRGGILDAALIGIGLITPGWEILLRPHLQSVGAAAPTQAVYLVKLLMLTASMGALLRIARTAGTARVSLNYFVISLVSTIVSVVTSLLSTRPDSDYYSPLVDVCAIVGYLGLAAAALHPSATEFTQPSGWRRGELAPVKLRHLGFVLALVPVVGSVPMLFGETPDTLLLSLGTLVVTPLVIMRIGLLLAERTADQEALRYQAHHDELTGLINRRRFFAVLEQEVERCHHGESPGLAVLYCDLNKFKIVNDEYGHEAGDHVLRTFAERLTGALRADDIAARIGGDEFLVLCRDADATDAEGLRRRVEELATEPVWWAGHELPLGVAVGMAAGAGADLSGDALVKAADTEMYVRKSPEPAPPVTVGRHRALV
ncbi:GGDEF domain-containing protein [Actinoplanes sp. NPDC049118]|uniref:GGDEF domain-containing protein n=1 Tax=Actinoplanes sp. NPDC049118 TaxID=3155769 RepID=UPI00340CF1C3